LQFRFALLEQRIVLMFAKLTRRSIYKRRNALTKVKKATDSFAH
jgi:hypothetical protein